MNLFSFNFPLHEYFFVLRTGKVRPPKNRTCSEDSDVRWLTAAHESIFGVKWLMIALKFNCAKTRLIFHNSCWLTRISEWRIKITKKSKNIILISSHLTFTKELARRAAASFQSPPFVECLNAVDFQTTWLTVALRKVVRVFHQGDVNMEGGTSYHHVINYC